MRTRRTKEQIRKDNYNRDVDAYNFYVVNLDTMRAETGFEFKEDAVDLLNDYDDKKKYKVVSKRALKSMGIENPNESFKYEAGGDFQSGVYAKGGGLESHGIKQGDTFLKTISGGIQQVKDKNGNIFYINLATGERSADIPLPFANGGEIRRFDRHAQMDSDTRSEIIYVIQDLEIRNPLTNYLYGLFDGYDYSKTKNFKIQMNKLRAKDFSLHKRIKEIYSKIDKYKFEKYNDFDEGGEVTYFINKDGIRVRSKVEPKEKLSEREWMAKHNESKEARSYAFGGFFGKSDMESKPKKINLNDKQVRLNSGEYVQVLDQDGDTLMVMELSKIGTGASPKMVKISDVDMTSFATGGGVEKFKVGDKVKIEYISDNSRHNNKIGTITWLNEYNYYPNGDYSVIKKKTQGIITYEDGSEEEVSDFYAKGSGITSPIKKVSFATGGRVKMNTEVILSENRPNGAEWQGVVKPFMLKSIEENQYAGGFKRYEIDIYDEVKREPTKEEIKQANEFFDKIGGRYADGGGVGLIGNQSKIDMNKNGRIDAEDFEIMRNTMDGAWRKERKYVNSTSRKNGKVIDYEVRYARKNNPSRKGYNGKTFSTGGFLKMLDGKLYERVKFSNGIEDWYEADLLHKVNFYCSQNGLNPNNQKDFEKALENVSKRSFATGGGVSKFEKLSNRVARNYEGKRVKPQYQKEYGKVYSKSEAKEVGDKVAGKVKANQKMATGGATKKGGQGAIMILAKKIRKDGEKWTDAVKRAGQQLK